MATKVGLDVEINLEGSNGQSPAKSLKDLKSELKELQGELSKTEQGTKEYTAVLQKMADVKDEVDDLNESVSALTGGGKFGAIANLGGSIASGFQAAQGAMALFGTESEEVEKALLKVQAVSAFADGLKGLEGIGDSLKNAKEAALGLWKAFLANPFMAIAAAVALIAVGVQKLTTYFSDEAKEVRKLEAEYELLKVQSDKLKTTYDNRAKVVSSQIELMKAQGKSQKEINEKIKEENENRIKSIEVGIGVEKQSLRIAAAKLKETVANDSLYEAGLRALSLTKNNAEREVIEKEIEKNKYERIQEGVKQYKEAQNAIITAESDLVVLKNNIRTKELNDQKSFNDQQSKLNEERFEKETAARIKAKKDLEDSELGEAAMLEQLRLADLEKQKQITAQNDWEVNAARDKEAAIIQASLDKYELEKKLAEEKRVIDERNQQFAVSSTMQTLSVIQQLTSSFAGKSEESQRKAFNINKAASIAEATISSILAAQKAFTSQLIAGDPTSPIRGAIAAGLAIAAGVARVAAIAKTQFNSGGGGGSSVSLPQGSTSGGGQGQGNAILNNTPTNTTTQINDNGTVNKPPPVKAYVLQAEMENENNLINQIQKKATI